MKIVLLLLFSTLMSPAWAQTEVWPTLPESQRETAIGTYYGQSGSGANIELFCFNGAYSNRYTTDTKKLYKPSRFQYDRLYQELILWNSSDSIIRAKILEPAETKKLTQLLLTSIVCSPSPISGSEARNEPRTREVFSAIQAICKAENTRGALTSATVIGPDGYYTVWLNSPAGLKIFLISPQKDKVIDWMTQLPPGVTPKICLRSLKI